MKNLADKIYNWFQVLNLEAIQGSSRYEVQRSVNAGERGHYYYYERDHRHIRQDLNYHFFTFLKRKNLLASSGTPKGLEDHGGQLKWIMAVVIPWWRKSLSQPPAKTRTLKEAGISLSKSTFKRCLHKQTRFQQPANYCNIQKQIRIKKASSSGISLFGQMKPKLAWTKMVEGEKEQLMIRGEPHLSNTLETVLWQGHVWLPVGLGHWCIFMWLLMNSEVYRAILLCNSIKCNKSDWRCFTLQLDYHPKYCILQKQCKIFSRQRNWIVFSGQANHLIST